MAGRGGGLRRLLYENPAFATHHLDVETDGVIAREQLRRWAGVKLEDNLLALDLERVKRDLELVPVFTRLPSSGSFRTRCASASSSVNRSRVSFIPFYARTASSSGALASSMQTAW